MLIESISAYNDAFLSPNVIDKLIWRDNLMIGINEFL
ncbi:hypothetical protein SESI111939_19860 [Serratia silvae]